MRTPFFAAILLISIPALASDYPPGYQVESSCQRQGPVEVCTANHHYGNYPRLSISYNGYLGNAPKSAFVKLNGRSGLYKFDNESTLYLNDPISYRCWVGGHPEWYEGPYNACAYDHPGSTGSLVWEVHPVPQNETDLFFYARDNHGLANAWDVEVAIVDESGQWDSLFGSNYRFRFK